MNDDDKAKRVWFSLPPLAQGIDKSLHHAAGERVGYCLIVFTSNRAQYITNCSNLNELQAGIKILLEQIQANVQPPTMNKLDS